MSDQGIGVLVGLLLGAAAGIGAATAMLKLLYNPRITYAVRIALGFVCVGLFIFGPIFLLVLVTRRLGLHTNGAGLPVAIVVELMPMAYAIFRLRRDNVWDYDLHAYVTRQRDGSADDAAKSRTLP
jgi:hypothetical protein